MTVKAKSAKAKVAKKKVKRSISAAIVHVQASYNNTIVTVTDLLGNVLSWATSGGSGFRGSRKSTPYAAQVAADKAIKAVKDYGIESVTVRVKGPGPGRESAVRKVFEHFKRVASIKDVTGVPFNGCRPAKQRRI